MFALGSCYPDKTWYRRQISHQENELLAAARSGKLDSTSVYQLLSRYELYANQYPHDPGTINMLYKAADFYRALNMPLRSVAIYEDLCGRFPQHPDRPKWLFLQGFIYESEIKNLHAARIKYEVFLKEFPDHPLAKDVHLSLRWLGKSPEEIVATFKSSTSDSARASSR